MIRIRCLVCREAFRWDATHGMPDNCPICREYIGSDGKDEVAIVNAGFRMSGEGPGTTEPPPRLDEHGDRIRAWLDSTP